ncbi:Uncharacterised protein [Pseudomonas aeruginosa]|nr:Uncharacterised protein [Pseudomonas aeruginosa]
MARSIPSRRWRFPARGAEHGDDTQTGGRGGGRLRLDRSDPGQGADRGRAQRGGAGARREPRYLSRRRLPEHPRRADLQHPRQAVPESLQEHREHPPRDQRHRAALPPALRFPSRRRRRWRRPALVRRAFPDHARGTALAQSLRGTLRQEIHPRRHDHPGLRGQLRGAGTALRFRREGLRHLRHRAYGQGPGGRHGQSVRRRPLGRLPAAGTAPGVLRATVPQGRRGTRPAPLRPAGGQRFGALDQPLRGADGAVQLLRLLQRLRLLHVFQGLAEPEHPAGAAPDPRCSNCAPTATCSRSTSTATAGKPPA